MKTVARGADKEGECIMSWRVAACTVASFLVITLSALAQPSTTPSVAEQELIRKLEEAGYTQVRDVNQRPKGSSRRR
jgi:hypothetical protein